jgi:hypothetical protein
MIDLIGPINSGEAAGEAGSATATGTTTRVISGRILGVYIKYNDSPPAETTDVVISTKGTAPAPPALVILTVTNAATNRWAWPRLTPQGVTGADLVALTVLEPAPVFDYLTVKIDGADAGDNVDVWFLTDK